MRNISRFRECVRLSELLVDISDFVRNERWKSSFGRQYKASIQQHWCFIVVKMEHFHQKYPFVWCVARWSTFSIALSYDDWVLMRRNEGPGLCSTRRIQQACSFLRTTRYYYLLRFNSARDCSILLRWFRCKARNSKSALLVVKRHQLCQPFAKITVLSPFEFVKFSKFHTANHQWLLTFRYIYSMVDPSAVAWYRTICG